MKGTKESLWKRVDESLEIDEIMYSDCILDMVHLLFIELSKLLEEEGRYFGIINSYLNTVQKVFDKIDETTDEDNYEIYGKAMYLFKPLLFKSFRKLRRRKVSKADCIITITKALLEYLIGLGNSKYRK